MHTKGPWKAVEMGSEGWTVQRPHEHNGVMLHRTVATNLNEDIARLIAAAPEQNAALIDLVALVKRIIPDADSLHEIHNADKAIRKAKGE